MDYAFSIHTVFILLGSFQGALLTLFLLTNSHKKTTNYILALLILLFTLNLLIPELTNIFYKEFPHLKSTADSFLYLFGPLLYFFTLFTCGGSNNFSKKDFLHLIPFLLGTCLLVPFFIKSSSEKIEYIEQVESNGLPTFYVIGWSLECLHIAIYLFFSIKLIEKYRHRIKDGFSNIEKINLSWLTYLLNGNLILWVFFSVILISYLGGLRQQTFEFIFSIFNYLTAIFIYVIGYKAMKQPEVFSQMTINSQKKESRSGKYTKSGLTQLKAATYSEALLEFMSEDSPYLNPDLTLRELSEALSIPNNYLSQIINEKFNQNFFDFINSYRVSESKAWLKDPARRKATMLEIAFESGFKSKSTFNAAFKKQTGITPSNYKKQQMSIQKSA